MKKIQMVDVVSQYEKYELEINKRILNVIKSGCYIQGEEVQKIENQLSHYLGVKHTISCGNGTDALYIALMSLGLQPGDEVLLPTFTFVSTVEAVCLLGLKPVFLDIEDNTFLLNPSLIEQHLSSRTRAIIPVHLFGQCCDMNVIEKIAKKYSLFIVEDAAQSLGSRVIENNSSNAIYSGTIGDIGITSFYPSKNLGCFGDGGAIFTQNSDLAKKIRLIANHGQAVKYHHDMVGLNSRLDAIQATVLSFKLPILNDFNNQRQNVAKLYDERLKKLDWLVCPFQSKKTDHIYHQYSILLSPLVNRDNFRNYLLEKNIPTMIYYPIPLHQQRAYSSYSNNPLPVSEDVAKRIISLPMHPDLDLLQVNYICDIIQKYN